eukprot:CAMPEP_0183381562 /NCGR_PEP_ID=MMETSP0164_2-20130417/126502_1 /TAXON_ID=221442 /ORGANISM="Coccolithus pelagicus ssp braarudi, Strain PLY182g" /LENGTH=77 /DNA_ID=CAMNT_0025559173 /DNA_START=465 /DNA_END=698 /DNA_ORIENTATION=+
MWGLGLGWACGWDWGGGQIEHRIGTHIRHQDVGDVTTIAGETKNSLQNSVYTSNPQGTPERPQSPTLPADGLPPVAV